MTRPQPGAAAPATQRVLLHAFSTFKLGGPQARFVQLANAYGAAYHHVVVAMDNCFEAGDRLSPNVSWEPLPLSIQRGGGLANRDFFRLLLKQRQPDLLLSYNWGAIEWAAANLPKCVPHVHVEDGFGPEEAQGQLPRRVWMRRVLLGWPGVPVVVPSRTLHHMATGVWRLRQKNVVCIPNGVAIPQPAAGGSTRGTAPHTGPVIGTVAGLRPEKNIARLLRAFASVRRQHTARLVVVGGGSLQPELERLAADLGVSDSVRFTGYLENPLDTLKTFDLFALSSDTEQLPIAMLEAMAHGIPVVATQVGDVAHILPPSCQDCIAPPDDAAFTAALTAAVNAPESWGAWAQANLDVVHQRYAIQSMLAKWKNVFDGNVRALA